MAGNDAASEVYAQNRLIDTKQVDISQELNKPGKSASQAKILGTVAR
jgi:hypothetical protein